MLRVTPVGGPHKLLLLVWGKDGLITLPEHREWSSFRRGGSGARGAIEIDCRNQPQKLERQTPSSPQKRRMMYPAAWATSSSPVCATKS